VDYPYKKQHYRKRIEQGQDRDHESGKPESADSADQGRNKGE